MRSVMLVEVGRVEVRELPVPEVEPGTVLLRVVRASVCNGSDAAVLSGRRDISVAYPFVEVVFRGESLQDWVRSEIQQADHTAAEKAAQIERLEAELAEAPASKQPALHAQIAVVITRGVEAYKDIALITGQVHHFPFSDSIHIVG